MWEYICPKNPIYLEEQLSKASATIEDALEDGLFIIELKAENPKILSFLDNAKIKQLIDLISIENYDEETSLTKRYKFPLVAAEVLASGSNGMLEFFFSLTEEKDKEESNSTNNLDYLFMQLQSQHVQQINLTILGYFSKILCTFLSKRTPQFLDYIMHSGNIETVKNFMFSKSMANVLAMIICLDNKFFETHSTDTFTSDRLLLLNWVINKFHSSNSFDEVANCSIIICDIFSRNSISDQQKLISTVFQIEHLHFLFEQIKIENHLKFNHAFSILEELTNYLFKTNETTLADPSLPEKKNTFFQVYITHLPFILPFLDDEENNHHGNQEWNSNKKVGMQRLKAINVLLVGADCQNADVMEALVENDVPGRVFDLFLKYPLNNIFHNSILQFLINCLESPFENVKVKGIVERANFPKRLFEFSEIYRKKQKLDSKFRLGSVGHIISFSRALMNKGKTDKIVQLILQTVEWKKYYEIFLKDAIKKEDIDLFGFGKDNFQDTPKSADQYENDSISLIIESAMNSNSIENNEDNNENNTSDDDIEDQQSATFEGPPQETIQIDESINRHRHHIHFNKKIRSNDNEQESSKIQLEKLEAIVIEGKTILTEANFWSFEIQHSVEELLCELSL